MKNENEDRFQPVYNTTAPDGIKAVFFDLDGTLLQVEMNAFVPEYLRGLAECFADIAKPEMLVDLLLDTTWKLLKADDGRHTNEQVYIEALRGRFEVDPGLYRSRLQVFFDRGLSHLSGYVRPLPLARDILQECFDRDLMVVLATNPVFPRPVVDARLKWGNLLDFPFRWVSSYENSRYCKPNPRYFTDLLAEVGLDASEVIMVGNDAEHDLAARKIGIPTFLVDTWMENRGGKDFITDFRGDHEALLSFVCDMPSGGGNN